MLHVQVFPDEDLARVKMEIAALGGSIFEEITTHWKTTLKVAVPPHRIGELAAITGVKWVEPEPQWKLNNNESTDTMNVRAPRDTYGLYGFGQTVGVCDSGLDQGSADPASLHDDFEDGAGASRVTAIFDRVGDGASDVNSGHGTHVAGSVLGNGDLSGCTPPSDSFPTTCFAGIAPKASLVFQAVENNSEQTLSGLPADLNTLFSQANGAGADLHTNSWGADVAGQYTADSQAVDEYMWDNNDFLILFAAGNAGEDLDADGVVDPYSIGSPATAKNCLTIGASEGDRPSGAGYDFNWSAFGFPADPINSDHVSDNVDGMAAFSSRGPTVDGRYKPDLTAPGTNILSTRSSLASGTGWGAYDASYMWNGGTSMATPLAAGAAALMREYLIDEVRITDPSAALIKAALINSAYDMSPGQYGTGATQEIPDSPVPNDVEGWGGLNLGSGLFPTAPFDIFHYDETSGLSTGELEEYTFQVESSGNPLKVNLAWTDYPGTPAAQGGLVNDLDMQLTDPSSTVLYPDNASQKSTVSTLAYDLDDIKDANNNNKRAIRFTPTSYPVTIESALFFFYNPYGSSTDVDVVVYDDDGSGGLPGSELFRKTLDYAPTGWRNIGISGVIIADGDFYIAIEKADLYQYLVIDTNYNPGNRGYLHNGSSWALSSDTAYIRANVRGTDYSTSFDRVNNVLGFTIDSPAVGSYTVKVSGHNVPQGPQPYALVISGNITSETLCGADGSGIDWDGADDTGGLESSDSCTTYETTTISGAKTIESTGSLTIQIGTGGSVALEPTFSAQGQLSIGLAP